MFAIPIRGLPKERSVLNNYPHVSCVHYSRLQGKQRIAESLSSRVNWAYQTLRSPLPRVEYLLDAQGIPLSEEDKTDDTTFLTQIYMEREGLEEAESTEELETIAQENNGCLYISSLFLFFR